MLPKSSSEKPEKFGTWMKFCFFAVTSLPIKPAATALPIQPAATSLSIGPTATSLPIQHTATVLDHLEQFTMSS